jgi:FecR protein
MKRLIKVSLAIGVWTFSGVVAAHAAGIGLVAGIRGEATVRHERDTKAQQLKFKDDLFWQDTLSTGTDANLRLLIQQKNVITMKELTQLQLREDLVGPNQAKKKSVVDLVAGTVRVVVDKEALKDSDYEVRTNMAVAAIRGSDVVGQTGKDRVKFCVGPESSATAVHRDPKVGRKELRNLQCADVSQEEIDVTNISLDAYRLLGGIPSGSPSSGGSPPPPGGGPKDPNKRPNNPYNILDNLNKPPKPPKGLNPPGP